MSERLTREQIERLRTDVTHIMTAEEFFALCDMALSSLSDGKQANEPRIVLCWNGLLIPDNSELLDDKQWLADTVDSVQSDDGAYPGEPLMELGVSPHLTGQAAVDYIKERRAALPVGKD